MATIVDGRNSTSGKTKSRQLFKKRVSAQARRAIQEAIKKGNGIADVGKDGLDVPISPDDLRQPTFRHGHGGNRRAVHPGNIFQRKDKIKRPESGGGKGGSKGATSDGIGEDSFIFHITREEFFELLFEDLGLPRMRKLNSSPNEMQRKRSGFSNSGQPSQLDTLRTVVNKKKRIAAESGPTNARILERLTEIRDILETYNTQAQPKTENKLWLPPLVRYRNLNREVDSLKDAFWKVATPEHQQRIEELEEEIETLEKKKKKVPKFDDKNDPKYRNYPAQPVPTNKAVMFMIMDVSGSMDEERKRLAKLHFLLLKAFLDDKYDGRVEVVPIRHHTTAEEVSEEVFFTKRETGGTVVSTALQMVDDIYQNRFKNDNWDVYTSQVSDGDNTNSDNTLCGELMQKILGYSRCSFYQEIAELPQNLWNTYAKLAEEHKGAFRIGRIREQSDIWPMFRELFAKEYKFDSVSGLKPSSVLSFSRGPS